MTRLTLNREFAVRHVGVALLMLGLSCWFGYDGFVRYPATPAAELYKTIEGRDAPDGIDLEAFKDQKTKTQYGFTLLTFLAALLIGGHVWLLSMFDFAFDETGFVYRGKRFAYGDVKTVDRRQWEKKGIVKVNGITLDAWHHAGVKEFMSRLPSGEATSSSL